MGEQGKEQVHVIPRSGNGSREPVYRDGVRVFDVGDSILEAKRYRDEGIPFETTPEFDASFSEMNSALSQFFSNQCSGFAKAIDAAIDAYIGIALDNPLFARLKNDETLMKDRAAILEAMYKTTVRSMLQKPSEFKDNPEACERFRQWFDGSGMSYKRLAEIIDANRETASNYVKNPETIKEYHAEMLKRHLGIEAYADMIEGDGAYAKRSAEQKRDDEISELTNKFAALVKRLGELPPCEAARDARLIGKMLAGAMH